jgi:hypothetical protein
MATLGVAAATAASATSAALTGKTLFEYNRKNFFFDRKMRLETEYQIMEFKIKKAELFRDDVRDIIGLTSVKMDTYLIVNAVQLGFCVMMFCEGRLAAGTPNWLIGCHTIALAGAFIYLMMSVWLSMHATIAAKSYEVRLLTQLVRLPVPSWTQLEGARTYASTFEKLEGKQLFRVPFAMGSQEGMVQRLHGNRGTEGEPAADGEDVFDHGPMLMDGDDDYDEPAVHTIPEEEEDEEGAEGTAGTGVPAFSSDPWGLERPGDAIYELDRAAMTDPKQLRHIQLVRKAMQYWQSYDAFSRVAMSIGTNQLISALCYYVLGYVLISNHAIVASWLAVVLFLAIACALIRLDMSLTSAEYRIAVALVVIGPVFTAICAKQWAASGTDTTVRILIPVVYVANAGWLLFILHISKIREQQGGVQLPTGFRSVLYIDVFGWIKDNPLSPMRRLAGPTADRLPIGTVGRSEKVSGAGPAVQSVRYANGSPVPLRVDQLPDAARPPRSSDISKADFAPDTFVPREKRDASDAQAYESSEVDKAGARPWKVFCGATVLLTVLWWCTGVLVTMELLGMDFLKVVPLTRDQEETIVQENEPVVEGNSTKFLQFGQEIHTEWPHGNIHALGLACNGDSNMVVASSRFGLYKANLDTATKDSLVQFKAAPLCQDIEGENLQDVSLECGTSRTGCQAMVLHQQGRQLAKCDLGATPTRKQSLLEAGRGSSTGSFGQIAEEWLNDGDVSGTTPESVMSLVVSSHCVGGAQLCAYVGTSDHRIVEMQQTGEGRTERKFVPHRLLQERLNSTAGASMDVIHGRYLGLLQQDGQEVQFIDLEKNGAVVGSWQIPSRPKNKHQAWSAMCAAGNNMFFFSEGQSPQLWRFDVPDELRPHTKTSKHEDASSTYAADDDDSKAPLGDWAQLDEVTVKKSVKPSLQLHQKTAEHTKETQADQGSVLIQAKMHRKKRNPPMSLHVSPDGDADHPPMPALRR